MCQGPLFAVTSAPRRLPQQLSPRYPEPRTRRVLSVVPGPPPLCSCSGRGSGTAERGSSIPSRVGLFIFHEDGLLVLAKWPQRTALLPGDTAQGCTRRRGGAARSQAGDFPLLAALALFLSLAERELSARLLPGIYSSVTNRAVTQPRRNLCAPVAFLRGLLSCR